MTQFWKCTRCGSPDNVIPASEVKSTPVVVPDTSPMDAAATLKTPELSDAVVGMQVNSDLCASCFSVVVTEALVTLFPSVVKRAADAFAARAAEVAA